MIKLISKDNPDILAFRVMGEMQQEDVDWLVERTIQKQERSDKGVLLYVEFEHFGELTLARMWTHFKMLLDHVFKLMDKIDPPVKEDNTKAIVNDTSAATGNK